MNFIKLYIGDYLRDTGTLTLAQHGAYMLMLLEHYATEKPLPTGRELHRLLRADSKAERDAIDFIAAKFWTLTETGLTNNRAHKEIERAANQRSINQEIGKRGGRPKRTEQITESVSESVAEAVSESKANRNPSQTPDTRHKAEGEDGEGKDSPEDRPAPPPPALTTDPHEPFAMTPQWRPSQRIESVAKNAGMDLAQYADVDGAVAEFIAYWLTQPTRRRTQHEWDHALLKSLKADRIRDGSTALATRNGYPRTSRDRNDGRAAAAAAAFEAPHAPQPEKTIDGIAQRIA